MNPRPFGLALWCLAIFAVTIMALLPAEHLQAPVFQWWDKAQHGLAFAVLAGAALLLWPWTPWRVCVGMLVYGALLEGAQWATGWRFAEWSDWFSDALGVGAAFMGIRVWHGGPYNVVAVQAWCHPNATDTVVVVGRSNHHRASSSLGALLSRLHDSGHSVLWFESRITQVERWCDRRFDECWRGSLSIWCQVHGVLGHRVRRHAKWLLLLLTRPHWWFYCKVRGGLQAHALAAAELGRFLKRIKARRVHLFAHSSGGIVCTLCASAPNVASLVCFGYPFRHPDKGQEPARTAHLRRVSQPFLIFQGQHDEYGSPAHAQHYPLGPDTRVLPLACDHDYDGLTQAELDYCAQWVQQTMGIKASTKEAPAQAQPTLLVTSPH